jgi:hypothetical protein
MLVRIKEIWNTYGFEILFILSLIIIAVLSLFRVGKKGSWSSSYSYDFRESKNIQKNNKNKRVIKESSGEKECRRVLQKIFNKPFNNQRPDFLLNPVTGGKFNLELDCYEELLKLAVEYQGRQHYEFVPYFHKNKEAFYNQMYRDDMKRRMCKDNGIHLIEIPYTIKVENIESIINQKLKQLGYI